MDWFLDGQKEEEEDDDDDDGDNDDDGYISGVFFFSCSGQGRGVGAGGMEK